MNPEELVRRVAERFIEDVTAEDVEGYKRPKNMVPVWNKEKERVVYVLPETMKEEGGVYENLDPDDLNSRGKPTYLRHPGQPQLPRKPKKPHKPQINRKPLPAPIAPPRHPDDRRNLPPRKPTRVKKVKPPKVPHVPRYEEFKRKKRYLQPVQADNATPERVLQKFLDALASSGV